MESLGQVGAVAWLVLLFLVSCGAASAQLPGSPVAPPLEVEVGIEPDAGPIAPGDAHVTRVLVTASCPTPAAYPNDVVLTYRVEHGWEGLEVVLEPDRGIVSFAPGDCLSTPTEREFEVEMSVLASMDVPALRDLGVQFQVLRDGELRASENWTGMVELRGGFGVELRGELQEIPDIGYRAQVVLKSEGNAALWARVVLEEGPAWGTVLFQEELEIPSYATHGFNSSAYWLTHVTSRDDPVRLVLHLDVVAAEDPSIHVGSHRLELELDPAAGTASIVSGPPESGVFWPLVLGVPLIVLVLLFFVGYAIARAAETRDRQPPRP